MIKKNKNLILIALSVILFLATLFSVFVLVVKLKTYEADDASIEAFASRYDYTAEKRDGYTAYLADSSEIGFVFYPGGLVSEESYEPLMYAIREKGISCFLVSMPFDLAVFDVNAAEKILEDNPTVKRWYIGGHSLGGAMAASHLKKNTDDYKGLILLGAYSTKDISSVSVNVLLVYGSNDGVMDREKYAECKQNLPKSTKEHIIEGGNHAYFGMYGEQKGDGVSTLTPSLQILLTADLIADFAK